ncbi:MAG: PVC-type heme-binding CxxCH protein [Verrucomicrobiales bacterium]
MKSSLLVSAALSCAFSPFAQGKELTGVYTPAPGACPSVEEAIKKMSLPDGYEVRNFAAEPMVVNPVAMTWDHRGRLWVVELYEYPKGAKKPNEYSKVASDENWRPVISAREKTSAGLAGPPPSDGSPRDRVIILEDTDNDGAADKRTVFLEGMNLATAILCGDGGIYLGQAPNLFFFRDTNGDDRADEFKTVLTGFGLEDRHELLNGFCWGPDGWLYMTHGVFTHSKVRRPSEPAEKGFKLDAGVFRVKIDARDKNGGPIAAAYEVFADGTSNPWGVDFDARGNAFVSACVIDHLFHMAPGGLYQRQGGSPEYPYAYELLPSIVHHKHFRAAYAGLQVYQGGVYPEDTHGHVFIGNIHDNAIHEEKLEPVGATFKASPVRDFVRANDGWFRPVSTQTGPDGNLWIMDWCDKYPCYQNAQANPEGVDRERGRIWRVVHGGAKAGTRPSREMDLKKLSLEELVKLLGDANNWMRRSARQTIVEIYPGVPTRNELLRLVMSEAPPAQKFEALSGISILFEQDYRGLEYIVKTKGPPSLLAWAARLYGQGGHVGRYWLADLASHADPGVQLAVAIAHRQKREVHLTTNRRHPSGDSMGRVRGPVELDDRLIRAAANSSERTLPFALWMSMEPVLAQDPMAWISWLGNHAPQTKPLSLKLAYKTMRRLCDMRKPEMADLAIEFVSKIERDADLLATALDGLVKGQEAGAVKPTREASTHFERWSKHEREDVRNFAGQLATLWGDAAAVRHLVSVVTNQNVKLEDRVKAIQTVRKLKAGQAREGLEKVLAEGGADTLVIEAMRAAAEIDGPKFADLILQRLVAGSGPVKSAAMEVLTSREAWAVKLLEAVEASSDKSVAATLAIPVPVRRFFAKHPKAELRERAETLLGKWNDTPDDIKGLIAQKRKACLEGEPDLALGKALFTATCATCHRFHGGGQEVGPELIGVGRANLDALLSNIIDPNQIIGRGYENFIVTTKDGRTLGGRLIEDTPSQVALLALGGRREVLARDQIAEMTNTGQSMMPLGFGALPDDQFRSLIWYVLAPPEEGPLTKEKKEALSRSIDAPAPKDSTESRPTTSGGSRESRPTALGGSTASRLTAQASIDWESVSLWNPDWKVIAPEFEGTPRRLSEYHGRKNVLEIHPFAEARKTPAALEHTAALPAEGATKLGFLAAAHDEGDWQLLLTVDGREVKRQLIDHRGERWQKIEVDLEAWKGQAPKVRIEAWANNWSWEFAYLAEVKFE